MSLVPFYFSVYLYISSSTLSPSSSAAAAATSLATVRYRPFCYHLLLATHDSGIHTVSLYRPIISCVAMYCATVLCLFITYYPVYSNPASCIFVSIGGYPQLPPPCRFCCPLVIRLDTLC